MSSGTRRAGEGLPQGLRLRSGGDFRRVFENPKRSVDAAFTVLARSNGTVEPRLGLAIARKRVRTAVARNRIKRIVRESFRRHLDAVQGLDIVVLARDGITRRTSAELRLALETHWRKLAQRHTDTRPPEEDSA